MKKRLLVIGGQGSGEIAMSVFEAANEVSKEWIIEGYLNDIRMPGEKLGKHKVVGGSEQIMDFVNKGYHIHYTLHFNAKNKYERVTKFKKLNIPIEANASAVHPLAYLNPSTKVGFGVIFLPFSATSFGAHIGNFIHVYTNGFIGHDSIIDDFSTITAHSIVGGRVQINEGAHIGLNSSIKEDISIGKYAIIGMGAVVTKDVPDKAIVVGNPAKILSKI